MLVASLLALLLVGCEIDSEVVDADADGWTLEQDCNDAEASIYPGAEERCDGLDNDCDDAVDNDATDTTTLYRDVDGDGFGDAASPATLCAGVDGYVSNSNDCNDADATVNPGAAELPYDGVDNDCDSHTPDDDLDGDGALAAEDCDDSDAAVHPGATELFYDGLDNDCDLATSDTPRSCAELPDGTPSGTYSIDPDGIGGITPYDSYCQLDFLDYTTALPAHYLQPSPGGTAISLDNTPGFNPNTDEGATLGRLLFYDPQLSANGQISCASCHQQAAGFADPAQLSEGFQGGQTARHSMGIINARFFGDQRFFWDLRADSLEEQVLMPIQDPVEMGMTLEGLEAVVAADEDYGPFFVAAFGDEEASSERISFALAQFIRSIVSTGSRYDEGRALVGHATNPFPNFTASENRGKELFFMPAPVGGAGCALCHGTEAFVGIGLGAFNNGLDADTSSDPGVFATTGLPADQGVFKTPSLRSVGLRAPYMHDGRFADLEAVVRHYNSGVQPHPNLADPLRAGDDPGPSGPTLPLRLNLSDDDVDALVAFLHTLDDHALATDERFSDPYVGSN